jgi:hypothetical protein
MSVKDALLGQTKPCANCKQESLVEDASLVPNPLPVDALPDEAYPVFTSNRPKHRIESEVGSTAKIILVAAIAILGFCGFTKRDSAPPLAMIYYSGAVSTSILAVVMWPIYTMANDIREIRKRLNEKK